MNKPMFMIANLALGGWGGAIDPAQLPAELKIDHIRAYALPDATIPAPAPAPTPAPAPAASAPAGVVLTSTGYGQTLTGGAGADTLNAGQGPDSLIGGAGADTFVFKALVWNAGKVTDFRVGVDKLDISALYVGGYKGANPVADGYVRFESDGAGGTKVMVDIDAGGAANPWPYHITTLTGVPAAGLTAAQVFNGGPAAIAPPQPPPAPAPSPGPAPPSSASTGVVLTSTGYGQTLTGGAGADTLNAGQGPDKLTGGAGADTFVFKALVWNAGKVTDFRVGLDKLDISALYVGGYKGSNPVADGYVRFESDGAGGTKVMVDIDAGGAANPWAYHITTLTGVPATGLTAAQVFNGQPAAVVAAPATTTVVPGVVLTSTSYGQTLTGGAGADTLNAGQGPDRLIGGGGGDHFVFGKLPWNAGHVGDFKPGSDVIDLRPLFKAAGYAGSNPLADGYVRFEADGAGGARVMFDPDGHGQASPWATTITTLDGVAPSSLTAADWLFR
jgi:hypothetical protein